MDACRQMGVPFLSPGFAVSQRCEQSKGGSGWRGAPLGLRAWTPGPTRRTTPTPSLPAGAGKGTGGPIPQCPVPPGGGGGSREWWVVDCPREGRDGTGSATAHRSAQGAVGMGARGGARAACGCRGGRRSGRAGGPAASPGPPGSGPAPGQGKGGGDPERTTFRRPLGWNNELVWIPPTSNSRDHRTPSGPVGGGHLAPGEGGWEGAVAGADGLRELDPRCGVLQREGRQRGCGRRAAGHHSARRNRLGTSLRRKISKKGAN